jgi:hypothetical protein
MVRWRAATLVTDTWYHFHHVRPSIDALRTIPSAEVPRIDVGVIVHHFPWVLDVAPKRNILVDETLFAEDAAGRMPNV